MPLVATNTNPVLFHISMCWYLSVFTGENLQVFQSDPSCFQRPLDEILSRKDFRKILFSVRHDWLLNSVICGFWKSIRKQTFYISLNVLAHNFFYRVYIVKLGLNLIKFIACVKLIFEIVFRHTCASYTAYW